MGAFVKGDVVVLPFPYSDLSKSKNRPAFVLAVPRPDEVIVCQITGRNTRPEYTIPINDDDFVEGGLSKPSFVRSNHIFMAEPKIIKYRAGKLEPAKTTEIIESAIRILREK